MPTAAHPINPSHQGISAMRILPLACLLVTAVSTAPIAAEEYAGSGDLTALKEQWEASLAADKQFVITTVHVDGNASIKGDAKHPPEAFPTAGLPEGGGLILTPPDDSGSWRVRSFVFQPSQIVVLEGDRVTLHFLDVQGPSHTIAVQGHDELIALKRGEMQSVTVDASEPGVINFASLERLPSMQGQVVVLARP
jgi:hypothetical protein